MDFENVGSGGVSGASELGEDDIINILYTTANDKLRFDEIAELMQSEASVNFVKAKKGVKNALDFQLITLLYLDQKKEEEGDKYVIISKDTGYDVSMDLARAYGSSPVYRMRSIAELLAARGNDPGMIKDICEGTWPAEEDSSEPEMQRATMIATPGPGADPTEKTDDTVWEMDELTFGVADMEDTAVSDDSWGLEELDSSTAGTGKTQPGSNEKKYTNHLKWKRIRSFMKDKGVIMDNDDCRFVSSALQNSIDKKTFYQKYVKKYGQKDGRTRYNVIKAYYDSLKNI